MAAVLEQIKSAAQNTGLATVTATFDAAPAAGSVLVLIVGADDYDSGLPSGMADGSGWALLNGQETFLGHYVWACTASGSGTSVDYTIGSAVPSCWILAEISGVTLTDVVAFGQFAQSSGTTYTTASTGNLAAGDWYLIASIGGSLGSGSMTLSTWLNSFTEQADVTTTLGSGTRDVVGYADRSVTADGSTAYSSGATYSSTAQSRTGIIVALPVSGGGAETGTLDLTGPAATFTADATAASDGTLDLAGPAASFTADAGAASSATLDSTGPAATLTADASAQADATLDLAGPAAMLTLDTGTTGTATLDAAGPAATLTLDAAASAAATVDPAAPAATLIADATATATAELAVTGPAATLTAGNGQPVTAGRLGLTSGYRIGLTVDYTIGLTATYRTGLQS